MAAFMTMDEVADYFRVSIQTVRRWRCEGKLSATRVGRRWLFERGYIERVVARRGANEDYSADLRRRMGGRGYRAL